MIIQNLVIGKDDAGHLLKCGDICKFKVKLERPKQYPTIEELEGMIIYDEDTYSFAFETLDNYVPLLLMQCAELRSIQHQFSISNIDSFKNMPIDEKNKWKEIYNNNLNILK